MNKNRLKLLQIFFTLFTIAIIARLFYWQILRSDLLSAQADSQYFNVYEIPGKRGEIKSSDGFSLVTNQPTFTVFAAIKDLEKPIQKTRDLLAPLFYEAARKEKINTDNNDDLLKLRKQIETDLDNNLGNDKLNWVALKRKIDLPTKEAISKLNLKGIGFQETESRYYPESSMAAQMLGFVGSDNSGHDQGYFGLEGYYNNELKSRPGKFKEEVDSSGRPILVGRRIGVPAEDGATLVTTIDRSIQYIVEKKLTEGLKKFGAAAASALVMDPKSGAILAVVNTPAYDPGRWDQYAEKSYKSTFVGDLYEPGSTFKVITMAAGLNEGLITPETRCPCNGPLQVSGYTINTWNNNYHPNETMTEVLQNSDNVGAGTVAQKLGRQKFFEYIKKFGFGDLTGIDLGEEVSGIVKDPLDSYDIDLVTNSFGQGISVTMVQLVQAIGAVANEGKMMRPFLVKSIQNGKRNVEIKPTQVRAVIKKETAVALTEMMVKAVESGEAHKIIPPGYKVAGKTGTAQVPIAGHYDPDKVVASFVGFAPADDPKFVMLVRYTEPSSSFPFGSVTAAPTFFEIAKDLFNYWGIPPAK